MTFYFCGIFAVKFRPVIVFSGVEVGETRLFWYTMQSHVTDTLNERARLNRRTVRNASCVRKKKKDSLLFIFLGIFRLKVDHISFGHG